MKKTASLLGIAVLGGVLTLVGYKVFIEKPQIIIERTVESKPKTIQTSYMATDNVVANSPTNFTDAAEKTVNAVVHVKNTAIKTQTNPYADLFYGRGSGTRKYEQIGTGSGVVISADGYIITNNHVIDNATDLEITLNNQKKYKAELIGTDPENDIALLKINADKPLAYIPFANSDAIQIGEWVLAVGNPYNLTSTVTAGIVSAKGRDLKGNSNVESFIQTDAAVNPGNSGGALVNTRGELVGINTAISSKTGSFVGYSFAVPSNIAKKIIEDLIEFGKVQEVILGITYNRAKEIEGEGVEISGVTNDGGANKAGLREGDIIVKVDNVKISKFSDLAGQLKAKRPGDFVSVTVDRDGATLNKKVKLSIKDRFNSVNYGLVLRDLTRSEKKVLGISFGVKITKDPGRENKESSIKGFIITRINNKKVVNASQVAKFLDVKKRYRVKIEMLNLKGKLVEFYIQ